MGKGYLERQVFDYFQLHDKDGDGKLNYEEFTTFYDVPIFEKRWDSLTIFRCLPTNFTSQVLSDNFCIWNLLIDLLKREVLLFRNGCVWVCEYSSTK